MRSVLLDIGLDTLVVNVTNLVATFLIFRDACKRYLNFAQLESLALETQDHFGCLDYLRDLIPLLAVQDKLEITICLLFHQY